MNSPVFDYSKIKLIVGLGNIGREYKNTRHNAGFLFLDYMYNSENFSEDSKLKSFIKRAENKVLAKPTTFMNLSGQAVSLISNYYKIKSHEILLVHDDLDIKLGEYKITYTKGPKVHNGIISVEETLKTNKFWRLRIGVDNRTPELRKHIKGNDYVLSSFLQEEKLILQKTFAKIKEENFN